MELIRPFAQLGKGDAAIAGGKGASLGEMMQAGIPVPPGFVVLTNAFERFLQEADLNQELDTIFHTVKHEEIRTVDLASERISSLITSAAMPDDIADEIRAEFKKLDARYVAVRSSATSEDGSTAAWAGQLDTFLNTTEENLIENVQKCWASLFTPRAIFYRFEKGMHGSKISVAVVVQKMVQSEVSGIAFSVHPVTEDYNQLIIEAGFGLGEAIVSGQVTPDSFVVEKEPRRIIDKNITFQSRALWRAENTGNEWRELSQEEGNKPALSDEQVLELSGMVLGIESHYGFPCDIEWAFEAGTFYITQSRPITTLHAVDPRDSLLDPANYHYAGLWRSLPFAIWFWSAWKMDDLMAKVELHADFGGELSVTGGHFYMHKKTREQFSLTLRKHFDAQDIVFFERLATEAKKVYGEGVAFSQTISQTSRDTREIYEAIVEHGKRMMFFWCLGWLTSDVLDDRLKEEAVREGLSELEVQRYIPQPDTPIIEQQKELRFLKKELEASGVWDVLKESPDAAIKRITDTPQLAAQFESHRKKYEWMQMMNWIGERLTLPMLLEQMTFLSGVEEETEARTLKTFAPYAEMAKHIAYVRQGGAEFSAVLINASLSLLHAVATERGLSYDEMLHLLPTEVYADEPATLKAKAVRRQNDNWIIYTDQNDTVQIIDDKDTVGRLASKLLPKIEASSGNEIKGQIGNKGFARGPVRIIYATDDFHKMRERDVLVTTMTTPDFVLLMQKSAAIVTDMGGLLCHAAIVSRELGKPCVISTKFATQLLKDGEMIEVDANSGIVRRLDMEADDSYANSNEAELVASIKTMDWFQDWNGVYTPLEVSLEGQTYFALFEKACGKGLSNVLVAYDGEMATGWFPTSEYEELGTYITEKMLDPIFRKTWLTTYRKLADALSAFIGYESHVLLKNIKAFREIYPFYGPYVIGTKMAFNFLPLGNEAIAHELEEVRKHTELIYKNSANRILQMIQLVSDQSRYPTELIRTLTADELEAYGEGHALPKQGVLEERTRVRGLYMHQGVPYPLSAAAIADIRASWKVSTDGKELRGVSAYPGVVRGACRIIENYSSAVSLNEGDILVTSMTDPNFIPLMQKASAFVTDGGGMLCHAAIVAREMKKPCIIGTKIATQVFKDGDLIEVNANTGIVHKL